MTEWREQKLENILYISKETFKPSNDEQYKYIGLEHIEQGSLRISGWGNSNTVQSNKYFFQKGDVLFGKLRPYFRKVIKAPFDGVCSTDIWVCRAKKNFDQNFLFYFLANQEFVDTANSTDEGTRMPRADWNYLKNTIWNLPPLPEQKAIAEVLSSLDDKIDLLTRQNKTLEDLAQAYFRKWFIEDASDEWEVGKLGDCVSVKGGSTPNTQINEYWNGNIAWATPKDLSKLSSLYLFDTERKITEKGLSQISSGLLPVNTILLSSRAPIGYIAINIIPVAINQGFIAINCDKIFTTYFALCWLKQNIELLIGAANGSTFLEISKSVFKNIQISIPSTKTIYTFESLVKPLFDKILSNTRQILTLQKLRDTLLPKLISGEIRVKM